MGRESGAVLQSGLRLAALVAVAILVAYICGRRTREGFASPEAHALYAASRDVFERTGGGATFSDYKLRVPQADAVTFTDVRSLWQAGRLSPETAQTAL